MKKLLLIMVLLAMTIGAAMSQDNVAFPKVASYTDSLKTATGRDTIDVYFDIQGLNAGYVTLTIYSTSFDTVNVYTKSSGLSVWSQHAVLDMSNGIVGTNIVATITKKEYLLYDAFPSGIRITTPDQSAASYFTLAAKPGEPTARPAISTDTIKVKIMGGIPASSLPLTGHLFEVATSGKPYTDPAVAYAAMSSGDVMYIYPGVYSSNLAITKENITIVGAGQDSTFLTGSDSVTTSCGEFRNLSFTGTLQFLGQSVASVTSVNNFWQVKQCNLFCNLNLGNTFTQLKSPVYLHECILNDSSKTIYINENATQKWWACQNTLNGFSQKMTITASSRLFCFDCYLTLIPALSCVGTIGATPGVTPQINVYGGNFGALLWTFKQPGNFVGFNCNLKLGSSGNGINITDSVEFDLFHVKLAFGSSATITWNSSSRSRWDYVESTTNINALTVNAANSLLIRNSLFKFTEPAGLLGDDMTTWNATVDL